MTPLIKIKAWLETCPCFPEGFTLQLDCLDAVPGSKGLYAQGVEEISRREDVLGNVTVVNRMTFLFYLVSCRGMEAQDREALWQFRNWVQQQSLSGLAPRFGNVPREERIAVEKENLNSVSQNGTKKYAVTVTAQFTEKLERS